MKKFLKRIFTPYITIKEQQHLIVNYRNQYEQVADFALTKQKQIKELEEALDNIKQKNSELQDEIDIQKAKAATYLSFYLKEMEKNLPNA